MTQLQTTLIALLDADDLKSAFGAWPDEICLAACLDRSGECRLVVFCRAERHSLPMRLVDLLEKSVDEVCFVPSVRGFGTRPFKYSDERRLMALVVSDPSILEEATDYAINLNYALEEGLDPTKLLGLPATSMSFENENRVARTATLAKTADPQNAEPTSSSEIGRRNLSPLLPEFLRKSAENARRPKFASVRTANVGPTFSHHQTALS